MCVRGCTGRRVGEPESRLFSRVIQLLAHSVRRSRLSGNTTQRERTGRTLT